MINASTCIVVSNSFMMSFTPNCIKYRSLKKNPLLRTAPEYFNEYD